MPGQIYPDNQPPLAFVYITGPGYFDAMSIGRRSGRDFAVSDTLKSQRVMIINETAAKRLWPGRHAIGQTASSGDTRYTVIGVVSDVRQSSLDEAATLQMYLPYTQQQGPGSFDLILRSPLPPAQLTSSLRATLATLAPNLLSSALRPLEDLVDRAVSPRRFLVAVLTGFSLLALVLACLGIYGVVSYTVSQRVQEIGLRMALGATGADVRRQILGGTLRLALLGIVLGVIAAIPLARLIAALLYQTSPGDVSTFAFTAGVLLLVALVAGYIPALRASRVDPMTALRTD